MMNYVSKHPKIVAAILGLAVITLIFVSISRSVRPPSSVRTEPYSQDLTAINSSFTRSTETFTINYGSTANPNQDAVQAPLRLFAVNSFSFPGTLKSSLLASVREALSHEAIPTYATASIQIDRDTFKCSDEYDCHFSFYLDSPEGYFSYHHYHNPDGSRAYTLKQEPLPGVKQ